MLDVRNIRITSFDLDRLDLWWEVSDTSEDVQDYDFYVLKAGSPLGPYVTLGGPLTDIYHFRDIQMSLLHQWRDLYYRVKVVHRQTGDETVFPETGAQIEGVPPLDGLEIRRQEWYLWREKIGKLVWVFKRRSFGMRCPNCFNQFSQRQSRGGCQTCFDTSYVGGYHYPIEALLQIDPESDGEQLMSLEKTEQQNTTARALWFPPLTPKDVIVEATNKRWRVVVRGKTERLRTVIHQEIQLHAIPKGDVEYLLPVNVNEETMIAGPPREYTNPHNPGELPDHLREMYDIYGI